MAEANSENNIDFHLADLTVIHKTEQRGSIQIEAFKSTLNDKILKDSINIGNSISRLNWVSIGNPQLVATASPSSTDDYKYFHFHPDGFYVYVDMLTELHRQEFIDYANFKYKIEIDKKQILNMPLSQFECSAKLFDADNKPLLLKGSVKQFNSFPMKLVFEYPKNSPEHVLFETRYNGEHKYHLEFLCKIASVGRTTQQNTLQIDANQQNKLQLTESLFGDANQISVTRNQLQDLKSDLITKLDIVEEYGIPEHQFSSTFIEDFIKQTATDLRPVPFEEALASLSKYNINEDIQPDVIKKEMSKIITISKKDGKEHIKLSNDKFQKIKTADKNTTKGLLKATTSFKILSGEASTEYVRDNSSDWEKSDKSVDDQLKELNENVHNDITWEREGTSIVPRCLKIAKLNKTEFEKTFHFTRIRNQFTDAAFKRYVTLQIPTRLVTASFSNELSNRLDSFNNEMNCKFAKLFDELVLELTKRGTEVLRRRFF